MKGILDEAAAIIFSEMFEPKIARLKAEIEELKQENKFHTYPKGIREYFNCDRQKAWRIWNKPNFPRIIENENGTEVRGAYSRDIEKFLRGER
ncbi:MAG: hypothetical protein KY428_12080 [Bacteroidetes bacterium]|nr:hypothetical protein [Bacteroidota bacterium]